MTDRRAKIPISVLHGVQHVIHPPVMLKEWPRGDRRTRMVFITHDIDEDALRASTRALAADHS
ncbi:MAG TPA: GTP-binding protein [Beijerinckiaceae bacterium]|nr:GTP-binding protein [Beijerinckiaceae bacterium]